MNRREFLKATTIPLLYKTNLRKEWGKKYNEIGKGSYDCFEKYFYCMNFPFEGYGLLSRKYNWKENSNEEITAEAIVNIYFKEVYVKYISRDINGKREFIDKRNNRIIIDDKMDILEYYFTNISQPLENSDIIYENIEDVFFDVDYNSHQFFKAEFLRKNIIKVRSVDKYERQIKIPIKNFFDFDFIELLMDNKGICKEIYTKTSSIILHAILEDYEK